MQDWHKGTTAEFKALDRKVAVALIDFAAGRKNIGKSTEIDGRTYTLDHISHSTSAFWGSRGLSIYYRVGRSVVRISDHWSKSNGNERSRKKNCGSISSSYWSIDNRADDDLACYSHGASRYPYQMLAGICGLAGFKRRAVAA